MKKLAFLAAITLWAQTADNVKVDTSQARALLVMEQPHHPGPMHVHPTSRVQVYLGAGEMAFTLPDGKVEKAVFKAGDVRWSPAGVRHISENISDHPFQLVEIELKNQPHPFTPSDLDPLKTDPKHYSLEFENDQVRVIRAHMGPHESVPVHEHTLNRVTVFLTDQNIRATNPDGKVQTMVHKAGDVIWSTPQTHKEENLNDRPFEVVAVEIKN